MRRGITLLILLFGILVSMNNKINFAKPNEDIPEDAIRLRILANSDSEEDQSIKIKVKDEVLKVINPLIKDANNSYEAEQIIYKNLDKIEDAVKRVLEKNEIDMDCYVDYGLTYFPEKEYNGKTYPSGRYNAVYIKLGEGEGDNWWCVLFPSLCVTDIATSGGAKNNTKVEYSFLIVEKIKELFGLNK